MRQHKVSAAAGTLAEGSIRIGVGGWTYEPWRGTFYPDSLPHARELEHASRRLTSIEINGTFYGPQKPHTFARWREETPEGFVFSLKAPRYATNRKVLAEAEQTIARFLSGGLLELKDKLGPINWQLAPTKKFEAADIERFFRLLPHELDGRHLRHAIEARHDSFRCSEFTALAREHEVAIVVAGDSKYPQIADITAPFVYARIMGTEQSAEFGYADAAIDRWAVRARAWARGTRVDDLSNVETRQGAPQPCDVYVYVIGGHKARNPAAALALIERLGR